MASPVRPQRQDERQAGQHSEKSKRSYSAIDAADTHPRPAEAVSGNASNLRHHQPVPLTHKGNATGPASLSDDSSKIINRAPAQQSRPRVSKINNSTATKINTSQTSKINIGGHKINKSPAIKIDKPFDGKARKPTGALPIGARPTKAQPTKTDQAPTDQAPTDKAPTKIDKPRSNSAGAATADDHVHARSDQVLKGRPVRSAVQGTLRGTRTIGKTTLRTTLDTAARTLDGAGTALSGDQPPSTKPVMALTARPDKAARPDESAKSDTGTTADSTRAAPRRTRAPAQHPDRARVTTAGRVLNTAAIQPTSRTVAALGSSHPTRTVVNAAGDLVDTVATHPSRTIPKLFDQLARTTPRELRPLVRQTGRTADLTTGPVTQLTDRTIRRTAPIVPVDDLAGAATTTVRRLPADRVDTAVDGLVHPLANTLYGSGHVVQDAAPLPLPKGPITALTGVVNEVTGGLSDVTSGLADATNSVPEPGRGIRSGGDAVVSPPVPPSGRPGAQATTAPGHSPNGSIEHLGEPSDRGAATTTSRQHAVGRNGAEPRLTPDATERSLRTTAVGLPSRWLTNATDDPAELSTPSTGVRHPAGTRTHDHRRGGGAPAQTGGSSSSSTNGGSGGSAQPATPSSDLQVPDLRGGLAAGRGNDVLGMTTAYEPGFSPD